MPGDVWNGSALRLPWFAGIADVIESIPDVARRTTWPSCDELNACFATSFAAANVVLRVAKKQRPQRHADGTLDVSSLYEVRIAQQGEIPTRPDNLHDFLNALMWAAMPRSKRALTHAVAMIQSQRAHGQRSLPVARSRAHDRLALVDEGGAIVFGSGHHVFLFGHAVLQHAYLGLPDVRCALVNIEDGDGNTDIATRQQLDDSLAKRLADESSLAAALMPGAGVYVSPAQLRDWQIARMLPTI